ncbi:SDR family NAD(P)-dependent oxidoreductase [Paenibacillus sp. HJL G12]|uniref:SDR family NAD(P)-dependent oxidoreductase n=1 Tax=Paenibacillus dendrobii TaxID=2691084 RepID=A0A7X3IKY2_9BACL|nr:SDR family NAD(P)-dependent oxidoreductase [Paenibacillus dendrobii]MWV45371.1 SDR family NAD(P)-dependent oxidoreductase [Paenibacillus dendrobii]
MNPINFQTVVEKLRNKEMSEQEARELLSTLKSRNSDPLGNPKEEEPAMAPSVRDCKIESSDIAVIGMSGQFPDAVSVDEFWHNLIQGHDAVRELPSHYLKQSPLIKDYRWGGILEERDCFDPLFFNISPREAESMNPHQRLILQESWKALEDAGYNPKSLAEAQVGIFIGAEPTGYLHESFTGYSDALVASRLSYYLDLKGPALVVNTGCSSSAVALHLACDSLRSGESTVALAGGAATLLDQSILSRLSDIGMLSQTGKCHTFDEASDGTVISEGLGVVVLKRLCNAIADGDPIYGVIKGSGMNQDGASNGITAPNGVAQEQLIRNVYEQFNIDPEAITYVEAHGTGTQLGDPIETNALIRAFRHFTDKETYCAIGSAKSFIGHTGAAAGVIGLIKTLLSLKHRRIPGLINFKTLNPFIDLHASAFYVNTLGTRWQSATGQPLTAAINSFGHSGTNVHLVLQEYEPPLSGMMDSPMASGPHLIPLSAKTQDRLLAYADKLLRYLKGQSVQPLIEPRTAAILPQVNTDLERHIRRLLSDILLVQESELEDDLQECGMEPIHFKQLEQQLHGELGIEVPLQVLRENHSIQAIAAYVAASSGGASASRVESSPKTIDRFVEEEQGISDIQLEKIAFTLQTGREAMEERVIFLVQDVTDLIIGLEAFIQGKDEPGSIWRGQVKKQKSAASVVGENLNESIERWMISGNRKKLAESWVQGADIRWERLYKDGIPGRMNLPTYPFAKERYWKPEAGSENNPTWTAPVPTVIHPLLHTNTSDLNEQRYTSTFNGNEFFLADHVIQGQRVLPGVAYLEMARMAVNMAAGDIDPEQNAIYMKNMVWARPITIRDQPVQVHIGLYPDNDGEIAYEIYSDESLNAQSSEEQIVHSQGSASVVRRTDTPCVNLSDLLDHCALYTISARECYEAYKGMGIDYGPGHQAVESIRVGQGQALAKLNLPAGIADTQDVYQLHPSLMDAALQATLGLRISLEDPHAIIPTALPFAMQEMEIHGECPSSVWAWVRYSEASRLSDSLQKMDIDIFDDLGKVCVRMKGFAMRGLEREGSSTSYETNETLLFEPCWEEQAAVPGTAAYAENWVLLCDPSGHLKQAQIEAQLNGLHCIWLQSDAEDTGGRFQQYAIQAFEHIQRILLNKPKESVLVQIVTVHQGDLLSALSGLLKTAHLENPKLIGQLIAFDTEEDLEAIADRIRENSSSKPEQHIMYDAGRRYVAGWSEMAVTNNADEEMPWKDGGVYLITGGAGGLGLVFTEEIVHKSNGATVILTGRSPLSDRKWNRMKEWEALGARIIYKQVDVSDRTAVEDLMSEIQTEYGQLNGIVHSAGVIRDNFILKKTKAEMLEVMAPKVSGLINLDMASLSIPLDFFISFSSGSGALGNAGQADYALANAFMDAFTKHRHGLVIAGKRHGRSLSVNWPLWRDGGMRVDAAVEQQMKRQQGMVAMQADEGIRALYLALASGKDQVMVIAGERQRILDHVHRSPYELEIKKAVVTDQEDSHVFASNKNHAALTISEDQLEEQAVQYIRQMLSTVIRLPASRIEAEASLDTYGIDSIMVMKLTNELEKIFGSLPKTLFFEYQTITAVTGYFLESYRDQLIDLLGVTSDSSRVEGQSRIQDAESNGESELSKGVRPGRKRSRFVPQRIDRSPEHHDETLDIAIIGVSGRYPGARNIEEYWTNLQEGKDCITEIPKDRWDHSIYYDADKDKPGKTYSRWGGFIDGVDQFDPLFFHISPREAELMDPQERLFLESVYEAMEDAGYTRQTLGQKHQGFGLEGNVGVYVGVMYEEYQLYGAEQTLLGNPVSLGASPSSIANRISYWCNFHGPSMAVDTMCSSSLTAIHLACQSLQRHGCELAIAGGVNLTVHPNKYLMLAQGKFASSKGLCESFGEGGDGYVPGEGVGAVLLKPVSKAIEDGDHIYGVIKGSSINHGGKTNGYTVPNPTAQAALITQAYQSAKIDPRTISYMEAHGTGTSLGDPIEIAGLTKAFRVYTPDQQFCAIGSAKSNIGHCESAAGIAGLTKVLLQMKHGQLAPSLHATTLNPNIDFSTTPFTVQQELTEWKRPWIQMNGEMKEIPRRAGLSSFGAGGSNAHLVIEEYQPPQMANVIAVTPQRPVIILLSAKSEDRLLVQAERLLGAIRNQQIPEDDLLNMAYTLQVGREAMEERMGFLVSSLKELEEHLHIFVQQQDRGLQVFRGQVKRNQDSLAVFAADEDMAQTIEAWIAKGKYAKLLDLWVKGLVFDWNKLYGQNQPRRISLPTYPFAEERYWVPQTSSVRPEAHAAEAVIHPLVHRNTSDFAGQRYSSTFTGQEFFLRDHVVQGKRILPGVAHLEMVRAAMTVAAGTVKEERIGVRLKNIAWVRPVVSEDRPLHIHTELFLEENGDVRFEITGEAESKDAEPVIYSQGIAVLRSAEDTPVLDIEMLRARCSDLVLEAESVYESLEQMGISYGITHRGIETIYTGSDQVLAKLSLPAIVQNTLTDYMLHPAMADAALQASAGLWLGAGNMGPTLPFALQELDCWGHCDADMWAYIRRSPGIGAGDSVQKLDIELCDLEGNVRVRMRGFSSRAAVAAGEDATLSMQSALPPEEEGVLLLTPSWREAPVAADATTPELTEHKVLLCELDHVTSQAVEAELGRVVRCSTLQSDAEGVDARYEAYVIQILGEIQRILNMRPKGKVLLQVVAPYNQENQLYRGIAGMFKTASLENPLFHGQWLEVEADETALDIAHKIQENACSPLDQEVRYQTSKRYVADWSDIVSESEPEGTLLPWKNGGVYLITGGAGGLGAIFADEIAVKSREVTLILTGRSILSAEKHAELEARMAAGTKLVYRQTNVADKQEVQALITNVRQEFGALDGIIHSAGVVKDSFILKKTEADVLEVLAPKVKGVLNLDEASAEVPLDFYVIFSSGSGAVGNVGQADYAAANAFMDRYAYYRNTLVAAGKRWGRTLSVNWPLWKEGGMRVDEDTEQRMQQATGMVPMQTHSGLQALYQALASGHDQVLVAEGNVRRLRSSYTSIVHDPPQGAAKPLSDKPSQQGKQTDSIAKLQMLRDKAIVFFKEMLSSVIKLPAHRIDADASLDKYGIDSVMVMNMTNQLEKSFGSLSKTLLFEYQSIHELTDYFMEMHQVQLTQWLGVEDKEEVPLTRHSTLANSAEPVSAVIGTGRRRAQTALRVEAQPQSSALDIAIVGISGRYPGAQNIEAYWDNLRDGKDCITEIPADRWDFSRYYDIDKNKAGKTNSKWGGFLDGVDRFDPLFFHISPREAELMDPQERLFLECAYETLEDAGYTREMLGSQQDPGGTNNVGVFVGVMYEEYQLYGAAAQSQGRPVALHGNPSSIANRVSYFGNFHGPSMAIDTMCSSSLTAIHLACQSIRQGSCELAIAGGVNVSIHPNKYLLLGQGNFASSKGRCESFGVDGDGYVPSEGVGAVLLKPLSRAIADGDQIYGVIKGTAINHGGKTNGYTVPNPKAQARVIEQAFQESGIDPRTITYMEAHGTGTSLGDPIEISGLTKTFSAYTTDKQFCSIGSVKSNIGHCESAAGIAGLTKILLQMKHRKLVPTLHAETLNPNIDFESTPFVVQQQLADWNQPAFVIDGQSRTYPRRAGISSFGAGGSNAHIVIEEYVSSEGEQPLVAFQSDHPAVIVLSATNKERLYEQAKRLRTAIQRRSLTDADLANMAYTLQVGREAMEERLALLADSMKDLERKLDDFLGNQEGSMDVYQGQVRNQKDRLALFDADEDLQIAMEAWLDKGKYAKLLNLWVHGVPFDWNKLYGDHKPRRISLPTYAFARERYWLPETEAKTHNGSQIVSVKSQFSLDKTYLDRLLDDVLNEAITVDAALIEMAQTRREL